jgi:hypothetical protein
MTRRRHTSDQIVRKLREADRLLNEGADGVAARNSAVPTSSPPK